MHILNIRPAPIGSGSVVARFDVQMTDDIRLFGLRLVQAPDGRFLTYAPTAGSTRVATFSPALAERLTRAASAVLEAVTAYDRRAA